MLEIETLYIVSNCSYCTFLEETFILKDTYFETTIKVISNFQLKHMLVKIGYLSSRTFPKDSSLALTIPKHPLKEIHIHSFIHDGWAKSR